MGRQGEYEYGQWAKDEAERQAVKSAEERQYLKERDELRQWEATNGAIERGVQADEKLTKAETMECARIIHAILRKRCVSPSHLVLFEKDLAQVATGIESLAWLKKEWKVS